MVHENGTENSLLFGSLVSRQRVEKVILASAILSTIKCRKPLGIMRNRVTKITLMALNRQSCDIEIV